MMGSGKTTLARGLSTILHWTYLPRSRHATKFLPDLFSDQSRWAFDTQISFLIEKALQVIQSNDLDQDVILDRSIHEDIFIFASYFYECGAIDKRSFETYQALAKYFLERAPVPNAVIYCNCKLQIALQRIENRDSGIRFTYPEEHLESMASRYAQWRDQLSGLPVIELDSEAVDFRSNENIRHLIQGPLAGALGGDGPQLQFFSRNARDSEMQRTLARRRGRSKTRKGRKEWLDLPPDLSLALSQPSVYIAAPFTTAASTKIQKNRQQLFEDRSSYGIIPPGPYRRALANLASAFQRLGFAPLLPHRDVNRWGRLHLSAPEVVDMCTEHVRRSDLFVGMLGQSHGSHYELGIARGLGKPCICITCEEILESFIASGVQSYSNVFHWRCNKVSEISALLKNKDVREFIYSRLGK